MDVLFFFVCVCARVLWSVPWCLSARGGGVTEGVCTVPKWPLQTPTVTPSSRAAEKNGIGGGKEEDEEEGGGGK